MSNKYKDQAEMSVNIINDKFSHVDAFGNYSSWNTIDNEYDRNAAITGTLSSVETPASLTSKAPKGGGSPRAIALITKAIADYSVVRLE